MGMFDNIYIEKELLPIPQHITAHFPDDLEW